MHPVPQSTYTEILEEIFANPVKTQKEFKIQSWRRKAQKLKDKDFFQGSMLNIVILAYENKNEEAIKLAKNLLPIARSIEEKDRVFEAIINCHVHLGLFHDAFEWIFKALDETKYMSNLYTAIRVMRSLTMFDKRIENHLKLIGNEQKEDLNHSVLKIYNDINSFKDLELNVEIYQKIIQKAFMIFYSHCHGGFDGMKEFGASCVSTILMNSKLDNETISKLNDEMVDALVELSDEYSYEELLKYPVIFTSENLVPEVSING